jgi:anthranilate synthase component 1
VAVVDTDAVAEAMRHVVSDTTAERYHRVVESAQEDIRAGEVFQVVLSQRFSLGCPADPVDVYRALRATNPSPYMYLFRLPHPDGSSYAVVGSSPEALVRVTGERAITHPIAGSRPRGKTPEDDVRLEAELLADPKERSEHVMLVDLGRNDLQRVCRPGTVDVVEFMDVRRYSHVMHIESTVVGDTRPGTSAYDVLVSTFPAGTLSGAPKPRALALIERYEQSRRGIYGGVVGYLDFHGDLDMAIAIRTAVVRDGTAYVQAGAGIVADSVPAREHEECVAKATAALRAVATAGAMRTVS